MHWKMQVNLKKTKIMVFQKKCRKSFNPSFRYKKDVIQKVNDYTYLGIKITSTGNFTLAEETLKENVLRALYASKRLLNFSMFRPKIAEKLFDTLVKPIILYSSEVWGRALIRKEILAHGTKAQLKKSTFVFVKFISESTPNAQIMQIMLVEWN